MQPQPVTLGGVIDQFRCAFGTAGWPRIAMPAFLLDLGAKLGDLANRLGWMPPMRTTAIAELRRGVTGDPARVDGGDRHRAEDHRADGRAAPRHHSGQMVRAAVPDQGAGHREPRAVLGRLRLHRAGRFPIDAAAGILRAHGFPPCAGRIPSPSAPA